jgi:hypothetical protein
MTMSRWSVALLAASAVLARSPLSRAKGTADSSVSEAADALFRLGQQFFDQQRYDEACQKFAESFRLDPATGALLALAACHEAQGKTASASAEYGEVVVRSRHEGRLDRVAAAEEHAARLRPRLSWLTITLGPGAANVSGLVVSRDGLPVDPATLGAPTAVDPGDHTVQAVAPGHEPWSARVPVGAGGASAWVAVPGLLVRVEFSEPPAAAAHPLLSLRTAAIGAGALGVVAVGISVGFGISAINNNNASSGNCNGNVCGPSGTQSRLEALSDGNVATVAFVAGGVLIAGAVALFVIDSRRASAPVARVSAALGDGMGGVSLAGEF